ncbi:MalY/PatB family protein [Intestinimonas massiliensis (ex Afouda et al. 2020)]|uniref:MalY/PatB family protein n=1 Tax=Intestinimonas massiliensis (ex Afouda et al. 2020) TaxID=1673721 RepID=UPI001031FE16|nr:MalY/PatB family protein [Intestinimonas massiliensis (ex Afouda et al. 2020)]
MKHNFDEIVDRRNGDSVKYSTKFYPPETIPMWVADSDFKAPAEVVHALTSRAEHGIYGYTPESEQLKSAVASWYDKRHQLAIGKDHVAYCPGVIPGIIYGIRAFSEPGDSVILQTPCYPPFVQSVERNLRKVKRNPLILKEGRYEVDFDGLEALCRQEQSKIFILCNPHNPTGRVFSQSELSRMGEICRKYGVVVLADEIHSDIIYPGQKHIPFSAVSQWAAQNSVTFLAASKTFNVPGLNTAAYYCQNPVLREGMERERAACKGYRENIFGTLALCVSFEQCEYYVEELCEYLWGNLQYASEILRDIPGIKPVSPEGTYLLWLDCRELGLAQAQLVKKFVNQAGVGLQSGTDFGPEGEGFMRMNFAVPRATLETALKRIKNVF